MPERLRRARSYAVGAWHAVARGDVNALRAGWWALRAARCVHRQLPRRGPVAVDLPRVPAVGSSAPERTARLVGAVVARRRASCLEAALVAQAWARAHGRPRDVIVGVTAPGKGFAAHAWLDGDEVDSRYVELWRVAPCARSEDARRRPFRILTAARG